MWVLIVVLVTASGGATSLTAEFGSEDACRKALRGVDDSYYGQVMTTKNGNCYPKG